ncbi:hypothetical protein [Rhodoferax aquaticus]|uniref:Uncharacterized protein n=1 Tax=Rhodoferax aquaticus TaxID=2527691 RepID=A0A515EUX8_9BURK|nr:hypothetical protein [Rhodoferax aquaticus]QDL56495.1 hypothetical protein EXZ61_21340 [Rhodoferax aquaticus]
MTLLSSLLLVNPRTLRIVSAAACLLAASLSHAQMAPSALATLEALQTSPDVCGGFGVPR